MVDLELSERCNPRGLLRNYTGVVEFRERLCVIRGLAVTRDEMLDFGLIGRENQLRDLNVELGFQTRGAGGSVVFHLKK